MTTKYTAQELAILRNLFDSVDVDRSGRIHINQLPGLVSKLGKTQGACSTLRALLKIWGCFECDSNPVHALTMVALPLPLPPPQMT